MSPWHLARLAAFDTETSGVDIERDRIVTASVALVGGGPEREVYEWVADPGIDIPDAAARIHGYTTDRVRAEGRPAAEVIAEVVATLAEALKAGIPLVIMNAPYDLSLLDREARRHGVTPLVDVVGEAGLFVIDPKVLDKQVSRRPGKRTLADLCSHYKVRIDGAHNSTADAVAAARVAWRIGCLYPGLGAMSLAELHEAQVGWAREQAASLEAHFRCQPGREAEVVDRSWPLRPLVEAVAR